MTLASDIVAAIAAATWTTITKPTMFAKETKEADLVPGTGWVDSGEEDDNHEILGTGDFCERTTEFELQIACATETNYDLYKANIIAIIPAMAVTGGFIEITKYPAERSTKRDLFKCKGVKKQWS